MHTLGKYPLLVLMYSLISFSCFSQGLEWVRTMGTIQNYPYVNDTIDGLDIFIDPIGNIYTTGSFEGTVDFDPGANVFNLTSKGFTDVFIQKLDASGNFLWAKSIGTVGGTNVASGCSINLDGSGNIFTTGYFYGVADFDPGVGVFNLSGANQGKQGFILKLDPFGEFLWAKSIRIAFNNTGIPSKVDLNGNVYYTGRFFGTTDFDPGLNTLNITAIDNSLNGYVGDAFVSKLDFNGNLLWIKTMGADGNQEGRSIEVDLYGNVYVLGSFVDTVDFDPGLGIYNLINNDISNSNFIQKLDTDGNLIWAKATGGASGYYSSATDNIVVDADQNICVTGRFEGTIDFDPGLDTLNLSSNGWQDVFIQKLDINGNLLWVKSTGGVNSESVSSISIDPLKNIYTVGQYNGTVDFDPGTGVTNLTSIQSGIFVQKLDSLGNFIWANSISETGFSPTASITTDTIENIYLASHFSGSVDFDSDSIGVYPLTNAALKDVFVTKWSQDSCSNLTLVVDSLSNISCVDVGFASCHAIGGVPPYSYVWNTTPAINDTVVSFGTPGIFDITIADASNCSKTRAFIINEPAFPSNHELNVNLLTSTFRPGNSSTISLDAFNDGCIPVSGQLVLVLDPLVNYTGASITPDLVVGDTLIWNFTSLTFDSIHLMPQVYVETNTSANIGDQVCFDLSITPIAGDADTTNNNKQYCFNIINSYDPNDKQVYPQGSCDSNYILQNERLTYSVRFQNTGNAEAINIYILDSLNSSLDINTVRIVGKSHTSLITEVLPSNVLKFRFDNIMLIDSMSNEPESHGYVIFDVQPFSGQPNETVIQNNVGIFFDYNFPIITNTVFNTIVNTIPLCNSEMAVQLKEDSEVLIYPNPTSNLLTIVCDQQVINEINILDLSGKLIKMKSTNTNSIKVADLPSGMYFLKLKINGEIITQKFIKE